jgi:hypothetical protein
VRFFRTAGEQEVVSASNSLVAVLGIKRQS